jgi:lambda family phage portal protein
LDQFGQPIPRAAERSNPSDRRRDMRQADVRLRARYDAAQLTEDTRRQWFMADGWQADAENMPGVRRLLRNRCRYEVANNCYAKGIAQTLVNDTIGTGPRLQINTPNDAANRRVQGLFNDWAEEVCLGEKLRIGRKAIFESGEIFYLLVTNPKLESPVKLDIVEIEADQVCTPDLIAYGPEAVDGIVFDRYGNPITYHILKYHPGTMLMGLGMQFDYDKIPADQVVHYFHKDRPGQRRGIPEATPSLLLFLQIRRFRLSVLTASETAADFAAVLYTDASPDDGAEEIEPMDHLDLAKKQMTTLPQGWKLGQIDAKQPTTTFGEFSGDLLGEAARAVNMPYNKAAGNSSKYNYASGRLDHQDYGVARRTDRSHIQRRVLNPIKRSWLDEAALVPGLIPDDMGPFYSWPCLWFWDGSGHVDPEKEANAQSTRLANNTTTLAEECGRDGKNWEDVIRQRAREITLMRALGLPLYDPTGVIVPSATPGQPAPVADDADDDDQAST